MADKKLQASGLLAGLIAVQAAWAVQPIPVSIDSQSIYGALRDFTQQSGLQILFPAGSELGSTVTQPIVGSFTPEVALKNLLAGTGLSYEFVNTRTIAIHVFAQEDLEVTSPQLPGSAQGGTSDRRAQSDSNDRQGAFSTDSRATEGRVQGIPEVLVKGSRSLNADIERSRDDVQPYVILGRDVIEGSGANNLQDLLRSRLTMNYSSSIGNFAQEKPFIGRGDTSLIALRGLDSSQTLVLIDGRRAVSSSIAGGQIQPDLNGIPLGAIERIEVLPTTASGIYGGGAVGGVVNVILRRDYKGGDVALNYETSSRGDGSVRRIDASGGTALFGGKTSVLLSASYSDSTPITVSDRKFVAEYGRRRYESLVAESGVSQVSVLGSTANVRSTSGEDLVLKDGTPLGSPVTSSPAGYLGIQSDGGVALVQNAGRVNTDPAQTAQARQALADVVGAPIVRAVDLTIRQKLGDRTEAFIELAANRNDSFVDFLSPTVNVRLRPTDPGNPFQQEIRVTAPIYKDGVTNVTKISNRRLVTGLKTNLSSSWNAELDYVMSRYDLIKSTIDGSDFLSSPSLVSDARAGGLDLLKDDSTSRSIGSYLLPSFLTKPTHSIQNDVTLRLAGSLFELPGGSVTLSALSEYRKERNAASTILTPQGDGSLGELKHTQQVGQNVSAYIELGVPLVSERNAVPGAHLLELQLASRYDKYTQQPGVFVETPEQPAPRSNRWSSVDPTLGFRYRPLLGVTIRGSYGTGFQPPSLINLVPNPSRSDVGTGYFDPKRGGEEIGDLVIYSGGNPYLRPENSTSRSVGVIIDPPNLDSLRLSFDWTQIHKKDNITAISFGQDSVDNEDLIPGIIIRGAVEGKDCTPVCPIIGHNAALVNNARAQVDSYDVSVDYVIEAERVGTIRFSLTGTRLVRQISQFNSLSPSTDSAGLSSSPEWNSVGTVEWLYGKIGAMWTARYFDSYWVNTDHSVDAAFGSAEVGSAVYNDLALKYRLHSPGGSRLSLANIDLRFGIKNVFDRLPRYAPFGLYDSWGNPQLRTYYVTVRKQF